MSLVVKVKQFAIYKPVKVQKNGKRYKQVKTMLFPITYAK